MRLTKRKALIDGLVLWKCVLANPHWGMDEKIDNVRKILGYVPRDYCPACHYAKSQTKTKNEMHCDYCPVVGWDAVTPCNSLGMEYDGWASAKTEEGRVVWADALVKRVERSLHVNVR